jgi:hypothetical protein
MRPPSSNAGQGMRSAAVSAAGRTPLGRITINAGSGYGTFGHGQSGGSEYYRGKSLGRGGFGKR